MNVLDEGNSLVTNFDSRQIKAAY